MFFDGIAVGLTGAAQNIEAFAMLPESDGDGIPDGIDNCPAVANPPSVCSGPGPETCPGGLSSECPMGENCVQADADGDGVGDPCDQCNGRPDEGTCDALPGRGMPGHLRWRHDPRMRSAATASSTSPPSSATSACQNGPSAARAR